MFRYLITSADKLKNIRVNICSDTCLDISEPVKSDLPSHPSPRPNSLLDYIPTNEHQQIIVRGGNNLEI